MEYLRSLFGLRYVKILIVAMLAAIFFAACGDEDPPSAEAQLSANFEEVEVAQDAGLDVPEGDERREQVAANRNQAVEILLEEGSIAPEKVLDMTGVNDDPNTTETYTDLVSRRNWAVAELAEQGIVGDELLYELLDIRTPYDPGNLRWQYHERFPETGEYRYNPTDLFALTAQRGWEPNDPPTTKDFMSYDDHDGSPITILSQTLEQAGVPDEANPAYAGEALSVYDLVPGSEYCLHIGEYSLLHHWFGLTLLPDMETFGHREVLVDFTYERARITYHRFEKPSYPVLTLDIGVNGRSLTTREDFNGYQMGLAPFPEADAGPPQAYVSGGACDGTAPLVGG